MAEEVPEDQQVAQSIIGDRIKKHRIMLEDRMVPDFGLLDKLYEISILTRGERDNIKLPMNTTETKNKKLLDYILEKNKEDELMVALRDTGQIHLVNYLKADGELNPQFGDDWPLSEREMKILRVNHGTLIDLLDTIDLCVELYSKEVLNIRQREFISSKPTNSEKNEAMLDILTRFSLRQYRKTIECLHETNQSHIAEILSDGGVVVAIHANLDGNDDRDADEDAIVMRLTEVIGNRTLEESIRLFELTLRLIAVKRGYSIVLYFFCKTFKELERLRDLLNTGLLGYLVETAFVQLLSANVGNVRLNWSDDAYEKSRHSLLRLNILPLKVLDAILLKVCLISTLTRNESMHKIRESDSEIICSFASVDECWSKRIQRSGFMRHLFGESLDI